MQKCLGMTVAIYVATMSRGDVRVSFRIGVENNSLQTLNILFSKAFAHLL